MAVPDAALGGAWNNSTNNHTVIVYPIAQSIYTVLAVSSSLSLAGCVFIIFSWFLFQDMHFFSRKLIVYISATDLFASAAFMYAGLQPGTGKDANHGTSLACTVQGFFLQFFVLASYLWTACFAFHLYQLISNRRRKAHQLEMYYHMISWGIPSIITIVLIVEKLTMHSAIVGASDRPWCWLTNHATESESWQMEMFQQFLFFYVPALVIFGYNTCIYFVLSKKVHGTELGANIRKRVLLYLGVFVVCSVWGFIHRIYQLFSKDHKPLFILSMAEAIFGPAQGFLNAVVYGISPKMRSRWIKICQPRPKPRESAYSRDAGLLGPEEITDTDRNIIHRHADSTHYSSHQSVVHDLTQPLNATLPQDSWRFDLSGQLTEEMQAGSFSDEGVWNVPRR